VAKALKKRDPRDITLAGFTLTAVGVKVAGKPTFDEWRGAMQFIDRAATGVMWWHGDMLNFGYATYGEMASQEEGDGRYSQQTLYAAKKVSDRVPIGIRIPNLAWEHHHIVAYLDHDQQRHWLQKADKENWSVARLRKETQDEKARVTLEENPLPKGKYNLIYADPPWRYDFSATSQELTPTNTASNEKGRKIENQYPTMPTEMICEIEVSEIAAPDCVLFLWATSPKLRDACQVMKAWGFEYKTCMVWVKDRIGMGYYARQQHELLLIGTCGNMSPPPPKDRPVSVIEAERTKHSKKPEAFYPILESMYPKAKRVELFCRKARKGWKAWGNEVSSP
jgi:N6-adenosine-specific RNA methylase IME4